MKTRIASRQNSCYELVIDDGTRGEDRKVLASMTLFEGTGCWMVTDIRLHQSRRPSAFSGGLVASDVLCYHKPQNEAEATFVKSLLREYRVDDDGGLHWSSFEGLVRGQPSDHGPLNDNQVGYFSRAAGKEELKRIQQFWSDFDGDPQAAKVNNPHRQLGETAVAAQAFIWRERLCSDRTQA